jgi:hypothetical protein
MMLIIPLLTATLIFLLLLGLQERGFSRFTGWRVAILQTALLLGAFVAVQSEVLSIFHILSQPYVFIIWLISLLLCGWLGWHYDLLQLGWKKFVTSVRKLDLFTIVTLGTFSGIFLLLLVIVIKAPPNNTDSLLYHMSRVVHWAENRSIGHYPTGFEPQLTNPIEAELFILQLRLFIGNDLLASLPQWLSMILCAIAVSLGAKLLNAGRKGQLVASAFAVSIPMGLLQSTSTQNDYVTAVWLIILAVFVLYASQEEIGWIEVSSISIALGLGLLTKGTFYPYAIAWGVWLGIHWIIQRKPLIFLKRGLVIALVVVILNVGYWTRNFITYGSPFGSPQWVSTMTSAYSGVLKPFTSNLVKDISLNLATPDTHINDWIVNIIKLTFQSTDPNVNNFQLIWKWNHEDTAGNPIHTILVIIAIAVIILLVIRGRIKNRNMIWYLLATVFSFLFFVLITHFDQYGVRYQLPLLILWAPIFGVVVSYLGERWLAPIAIICFVLVSMPYVFFNSPRPLIAMKNSPEPLAIHTVRGLGNTQTSSILLADQSTLLFANWSGLKKPFMELTHDIQNSGCKQIGLRIDSHDMEYTFWWLLQAPQNGTRIESLYYSNVLNRYADPNFKPCAIICTICGDRTRLHGLDLYGSYDSIVKLFIGDSYSSNKDQ